MAKPRQTKTTRAAATSAARKASRKTTGRRNAAKAARPAAAKSRRAKKAAPKKAASKVAKTVAKTARAPSSRARTGRARAAAPNRAAPKRAAAKPMRPPQRVAVSHYRNADFESGLRSYAQYRDLGVVDATHGLARAHVLRFTEPCDPAVVSKLHHHNTEFQMVYVLKGWVKTELEGEGEITMRAGSAWTQPPNIRHKINDYSEDAELLEVILPADFETQELAG